jgi:hypothetical protein
MKILGKKEFKVENIKLPNMFIQNIKNTYSKRDITLTGYEFSKDKINYVICVQHLFHY